MLPKLLNRLIQAGVVAVCLLCSLLTAWALGFMVCKVIGWCDHWAVALSFGLAALLLQASLILFCIGVYVDTVLDGVIGGGRVTSTGKYVHDAVGRKEAHDFSRGRNCDPFR